MPSGLGLLALPWTLLTPGGSSATLAAVPWDGYRYHGGKPAQGQNAIILLLFPAPQTKPGDDRGHGGRKSGFPNRKTSLNDRYFGAASIHSCNFGVNRSRMKGLFVGTVFKKVCGIQPKKRDVPKVFSQIAVSWSCGPCSLRMQGQSR